ncbi:MAG: hypothetical protein ACL7AX_11360 [Candidatus Arsenophonus phytopathogenicus]
MATVGLPEVYNLVFEIGMVLAVMEVIRVRVLVGMRAAVVRVAVPAGMKEAVVSAVVRVEMVQMTRMILLLR